MAVTKEEKIDFIRACSTLESLGYSGAGILAEMMRVEHHVAGDVVAAAGHSASHIYVVGEGTLAIHVPGAEAPVRTMGPGSILGEYGLFEERRRTSTIMAESDCLLLTLEYAKFRDFLRQFPEVMYDLLETAVVRLTKLDAEAGGKA